jgi:hypothetical protein
MAKITAVDERTNAKTAEKFLSITLTGKPEVVVSKNGLPSVRIPSINLPMNLSMEVATAAGIVPGGDFDGTVTYTTVPEYEFTTKDGEKLKSTRGVALLNTHGVVVCTNQANGANSSQNMEKKAPSIPNVVITEETPVEETV